VKFPEIEMPGSLGIAYWPDYGFVRPSHTTTNGSLLFLLKCLSPEHHDEVLTWAHSVLTTYLAEGNGSNYSLHIAGEFKKQIETLRRQHG